VKTILSSFGYINLSKGEEEKKKVLDFVKPIFPSEVLIYGF
jgi:hypothetical protein